MPQHAPLTIPTGSGSHFSLLKKPLRQPQPLGRVKIALGGGGRAIGSLLRAKGGSGGAGGARGGLGGAKGGPDIAKGVGVGLEGAWVQPQRGLG